MGLGIRFWYFVTVAGAHVQAFCAGIDSFAGMFSEVGKIEGENE